MEFSRADGPSWTSVPRDQGSRVPTGGPAPDFYKKFYFVPWSTPFEDPIDLPDGRRLLTLKDAADYIAELPKEQSDLVDWQVAIEALMLCIREGHPLLARIAFMKALNRSVVIPFDPNARKRHWGKRKPKRDQ